MTVPGEHKIFLKSRKGFVKLAMIYGTDLVPMYAFGENEAYTISQFLSPLRHWMQRTLGIGICIFWGWGGTIIPHKVKLQIEIGKPIPVPKTPKADITPQALDALHLTFVTEMQRLFERTKAKHGLGSAKLEIL